jgi:hypothetical protein
MAQLTEWYRITMRRYSQLLSDPRSDSQLVYPNLCLPDPLSLPPVFPTSVFRIPTPASQRLVFPSSRLRNHWLPNSGFPTSVSPTSALSSLHSPLNPALLPSSFRTPVLPKSCIPNSCIQCPRLRTTTSEPPPPNSRLPTSALSNLRSPLNPALLPPVLPNPSFRTPVLPKSSIPNSECVQCPCLRTTTSEPLSPQSPPPSSQLPNPRALNSRLPNSLLPTPAESEPPSSKLPSPNPHLKLPARLLCLIDLHDPHLVGSYNVFCIPSGSYNVSAASCLIRRFRRGKRTE